MHTWAASTSGGLLLGVCFLFPSLGYFAYLAFVPLFLYMRVLTCGQIYQHALWMGVVAFSLANHWIYFFLYNLTGSHWLATSVSTAYFVYGANAIALLFVLLHQLRQRIPQYGFILSAPLLAALWLHGFPLLFELNLAQTQVNFPLITAPIRLTCQWSLTALILLINLLLAEWIIVISRKIDNDQKLYSTFRLTSELRIALAISLPTLLWLCVGRAALPETERNQHTSLTLGILQTDDAPGYIVPYARAGHTLAYPPELQQAYTLAQQGAQVIVWPESRPKGILTNDWVRQSYAIHAQLMKANLIVQDIARSEESKEAYINASLMFSRDGDQVTYRKMKPIPFGESIPKVFRFEPVQTWLERLFKNIYKQVEAGTQTELFAVGDHTILPLICYEIFASQHIIQTINEHPEIDLMVLQSNDRWFFSHRQVLMHNAVAQLRAVETARPILHVVNGGPSFFIDARGNITAVTEYRRAAAHLIEVSL